MMGPSSLLRDPALHLSSGPARWLCRSSLQEKRSLCWKCPRLHRSLPPFPTVSVHFHCSEVATPIFLLRGAPVLSPGKCLCRCWSPFSLGEPEKEAGNVLGSRTGSPSKVTATRGGGAGCSPRAVCAVAGRAALGQAQAVEVLWAPTWADPAWGIAYDTEAVLIFHCT